MFLFLFSLSVPCNNCVQTTDGQAYCSKTCQLIDQSSLARSYPIPSYSRANFDLPVVASPRPASARQSRPRPSRRARTSEPIYNNARFADDELNLDSDPIVLNRWSGKDRAGIVRWARSVHPGLEEEVSSVPSMDHPTPAVVELQRVLARPSPFPLTTQNLAPPCVTVTPRHLLLTKSSLHAHLDDRTSASQTQDDASLLTPATESVVTPSIPDTPLPADKPFLGRVVHRVYSWMGGSPPAPLPSSEGNISPAEDDSGLDHSDDTVLVQTPPHHKFSAAVDMPDTPIRRRALRLESYNLDSA